MVFVHQHKTIKGTTYASAPTGQQTVKEKCDMCDVMHHHVMDTTISSGFFISVSASPLLKVFNYHFTSIQLILSCGRAPPFTA
jgi:hypothetical protein